MHPMMRIEPTLHSTKQSLTHLPEHEAKGITATNLITGGLDSTLALEKYKHGNLQDQHGTLQLSGGSCQHGWSSVQPHRIRDRGAPESAAISLPYIVARCIPGRLGHFLLSPFNFATAHSIHPACWLRTSVIINPNSQPWIAYLKIASYPDC